LLREIPSQSMNLILTSPPFALKRQKDYGNVGEEEYIPWFCNFAIEFKRILRDDGSLVIDIGGTWTEGQPTRSLYNHECDRKLWKPPAGFSTLPKNSHLERKTRLESDWRAINQWEVLMLLRILARLISFRAINTLSYGGYL
jgi:hypothetical protein